MLILNKKYSKIKTFTCTLRGNNFYMKLYINWISDIFPEKKNQYKNRFLIYVVTKDISHLTQQKIKLKCIQSRYIWCNKKTWLFQQQLKGLQQSQYYIVFLIKLHTLTQNKMQYYSMYMEFNEESNWNSKIHLNVEIKNVEIT